MKGRWSTCWAVDVKGLTNAAGAGGRATQEQFPRSGSFAEDAVALKPA